MRLKKYSADNTALFEKIPVPQAVRTMALPTIFSQIIILIYNMADTFYLGRTGDPYMVAGLTGMGVGIASFCRTASPAAISFSRSTK